MGSRGARATSWAGIALDWRGLAHGIRGAPDGFPRGSTGPVGSSRGACAGLARRPHEAWVRADFAGFRRARRGFPAACASLARGLRRARAGLRGPRAGLCGARAGRARAARGVPAAFAQGSRAVCLWLSRGSCAVPRGPREASFGPVLGRCRARPAFLLDLHKACAMLARGGAGLARASRGPTRLGSLGAQAAATRKCDKFARFSARAFRAQWCGTTMRLPCAVWFGHGLAGNLQHALRCGALGAGELSAWCSPPFPVNPVQATHCTRAHAEFRDEGKLIDMPRSMLYTRRGPGLFI